jgi:hypothetical protein
MDEARGRRGRLSSIDLLPDEARPHVIAALAALKERKRTQDDIRDELNNHLLAMGIDPVSKSAFNRTALHYAMYGRRMMELREMSAHFAQKMDEIPDADVGMLLNEQLKSMAYDLLGELTLSDDAVSMKMLKEASLLVHRLEAAKKLTAQSHKQIVDNYAAKASKVVESVAKTRGLSADTAEEIKAKILGIAPK